MLYSLQCYLTDYCDLKCPGCYRRAMAPNGAPDKLLPVSDIIHYVRAIRDNDKFEQVVVFSGGEILTAPVPYLHEAIQTTLDMTVSVDNKIHPEQSADWMQAIADRLASDAALRDKVSLKISAFRDNRNWFQGAVFRGNWPHVRDETWLNEHIMAFTYDGMPVHVFFSDFVYVPHVPTPITDRVIFPGHDGEYLAVLYMHPDRTMSFEELDTLRAVGRVPYVNVSGTCRPLKKVYKDMRKTLWAQIWAGLPQR